MGLLILASFVQNKPETTNGIICMVLFAIGLIKEVGAKKDTGLIKKYLAEIDYQTLLLLGGLFVVIAGIREAGVVDSVARLFVQVGSNNIFVIYTLIVGLGYSVGFYRQHPMWPPCCPWWQAL